MARQRKRNFKKKNLKRKTPSSIFINTIISILAIICLFFIYGSFKDMIFPPSRVSDANSLEEFFTKNKNKFTEKTGEIIEVAVYNGCGEKNIARLYTEYLRESGFDVVEEDNAEHFNYENTEIWIFDKKGAKANYLADILGVDENHIKFHSLEKTSFFDLKLIVGKDHYELESYNDVMRHYGLVN